MFCSLKQVFLKFREIHRKTPVQSLLFDKAAVCNLQLYLKRDSGTGVPCEFWENFQNSFL